MKTLCVYYDNPNEYSDMYLKWLTKDCEENGIELIVAHDMKEFDDYYYGYARTKVLPLMPVKSNEILEILNHDCHSDIDGVASTYYKDATAEGIYDYITENFPERKNVIAVIGRGKVCKSLIDMLIDYGYTVFEFNSASSDNRMYVGCVECANVVIGVASEQVFDEEKCDVLTDMDITLIDSGNNFETKNKLRCGKWTRQVIIDRVLDR